MEDSNLRDSSYSHSQITTPIASRSIKPRIVLAPLTRSRSLGRIAQPSQAALYYVQRTSPEGFLIVEATGVSATAEGWKDTPAIRNDEQTEAWKPIVIAVHDKRGIFFCQLWHLGRHSAAGSLSPFSDYGDATNSDPIALGTYMAQELSERKIAYVHYVEASQRINVNEAITQESLWAFRRAFTGGVFVVAGGYNREDGIEEVKSGKGDAVAYGRHFLANLDLPKRFQLNAPLNEYDRDTFYTADPVLGHTDYPFLEESHPEFAVPS